jgi:hypothetical protein
MTRAGGKSEIDWGCRSHDITLSMCFSRFDRHLTSPPPRPLFLSHNHQPPLLTSVQQDKTSRPAAQLKKNAKKTIIPGLQASGSRALPWAKVDGWENEDWSSPRSFRCQTVSTLCAEHRSAEDSQRWSHLMSQLPILPNIVMEGLDLVPAWH